VSGIERAEVVSRGFIESVSDSKGSVLIVAAAGESIDAQSCSTSNPAVPACIGYPYRTNVLTVAAGQILHGRGGPRKQLMTGSAYGPHVALAAPGYDVWSSGTSQATAFVTGVAAALQARDVGSATEIAERILYTADLDSGISPAQVSYGWVNGDRAVTQDPHRDWVTRDGSDSTSGQLKVLNSKALLHLYQRSQREAVAIINPAAVRRIFRDQSNLDVFSYTVIYRSQLPEYLVPLEQLKDKDQAGAERLNCGLKIIRNVYFLPLGPDNLIAGSDTLSCDGSSHCPHKIFEFTPTGGVPQVLSLLGIDDLTRKIGSSVNHEKSRKCL
jgi:hypothetical protein